MLISATIGNLEATKLQNESTIQELEGEINKLKDKLAWLEKERTNLERMKSDLTQSQMSQLKSLEKVSLKAKIVLYIGAFCFVDVQV